MKGRSNVNGANNDNWETPTYIIDRIQEKIFQGQSFFDPCPLAIDDGGDIKYNLTDYKLIGRKTILSIPHTI